MGMGWGSATTHTVCVSVCRWVKSPLREAWRLCPSGEWMRHSDEGPQREKQKKTSWALEGVGGDPSPHEDGSAVPHCTGQTCLYTL